jgi:hypothetical protein
MTHPMVEDTVVRGRATYEWLGGVRFLIHLAVSDHPDFPDSLKASVSINFSWILVTLQ